jgi:magnesium-protoporphyrin O-methyltransferase
VDIAQHKARLRQYFDGVGFERWSAIYGQAELSPIRRSIRDGHAAMLTQAEAWLDADGPRGGAALDAGCGTGLFSLALARRGLEVSAADIAPQMVEAASGAAHAAGLGGRVRCQVSDLEDLRGSYAVVSCFDVLIHYPPALFAPMLRHLAGLATHTLLFTYAPSTPLLAALHKVGGVFPKSQRRTDIQMIPEALVRATLAECGLRLARSQRVSKGFYHVTLVQAVR